MEKNVQANSASSELSQGRLFIADSPTPGLEKAHAFSTGLSRLLLLPFPPMKRTLAILALALFTAAAHAADDFYTGAYWTLKAPLAVSREAGQANVTLRPDYTVTVDCLYNGNSSITATGSWSAWKGKIAFDAKAYLGSTAGGLPNWAFFYGRASDGLVTGTFSIFYNVEKYTGKFQATHP